MKRTQGVVDARKQKDAGAAVGWRALATGQMTPEQAKQWIEGNVKDMASAKVALKMLGRAVIYLAKRVDFE
ncbi:MAG: hypothetical protein FJ026_00450 [Chloroflexi bacterium]|nr:hypothetical protein [Chloroflexota bacterium]